jgi:hypothetical protein
MNLDYRGGRIKEAGDGNSMQCVIKLALNVVDKWRSSVGIVRPRTKGHGVCLFVSLRSNITLVII